MPNHITNRLRFKGEQSVIDEMLASIKIVDEEKGKTFPIDFEKIVPPPANMFRGSLSSDDEERCAKQGIPTWCDWRRKHWGTKWNAYNQKHGDGNEIWFETAWSAPHPVIEKLAEMYPTIEIEHTWADEDVAYNLGKATYLNGDETSYLPKEGSRNAYELYFELHPDNRLYYELIDGEYKYIED